MSSPVLWGPALANNIQTGMQFANGSGPSVLTGAVNPSSVATAGVAGSLYLNTSGSVYKKLDNGTTTNWSVLLAAQSSYSPTVQQFLSGSGTYTTPANCSYIMVRMLGGGGGSSGSGTSAPSLAADGTSTTFGSSLLTAGFGSQGVFSSGTGGGGGSPVINSPAIGFGIPGCPGEGAGYNASSGTNLNGGAGGATPLGFAPGAGAGQTGVAGQANSGQGGGGAGTGTTAASYAGSGGGAGAYLEAFISSPAATYSYTVGDGGGGGGGGTSGFAGASGGSGFIEVIEFYTSPGGAAGSGITRSILSVSTPTTLAATAATDYVYLVSGTTTVTLPTAVGNTNLYTVKNTGVATVSLAFTGGQTGDGSSSISLTPNTALSLISDNANWRIV